MADWPYGTKQWRLARQFVLARDRGTCQIRAAGCRGEARTVDHIIEVSAGGAPFDVANLRAACVSCNSAKANDRRLGRPPADRLAASERWR